MKHAILAALLCAAAFAPAEAAEWYVNNLNGNDHNPGSAPTKAFRSLKKAVDLARGGDTIHLAATGTPYYETLHISGTRGTAAAPLVVDGHRAVISGLTPVKPEHWQTRDNLFYYPDRKMGSNCHPKLFENGKELRRASSIKAIGPGEYCWNGSGFLFHPAPGRKPGDYRLTASLRDSGVALSNARNVVIRNLICEHHANDGFNIHGSSHSLLFENIIGRHNGDDGFSIHEDGEAVIRNAEFFGNDYGIEDINASRSFFTGVTIHHNRVGVHFSGGQHSLVDARLYDNPTQIRIDSGRPSTYLGKRQDLFPYRGSVFIKNAAVTGGTVGLSVNGNAEALVVFSLFRDQTNGIELTGNAVADCHGVIVSGAKDATLRLASATAFTGDCNQFYPDRILIGGNKASLQALQATGENRRSINTVPELNADGRSRVQPFAQTSPRVRLGPEQ